MSTRFDHVALRVHDVDATVEHYKRTLGCRSILLDDGGETVGKAALCALDDGRILEVFDNGRGYAASHAPALGPIHYAISVDDVDDAYRRALADGAEALRPPTDNEMRLWPGIVFRTAFVFDLNGTVCEFMQHGWSESLFRRAAGAGKQAR